MGEVDYTAVIDLNLETVVPNVAGPKRPQDRIPLSELGQMFREWLTCPPAAGGYGVMQAPAANPRKEGPTRCFARRCRDRRDHVVHQYI